MIIGGGPTQGPLIETALEMGLRVVVADAHPVNPEVWKAHYVVRIPAQDREGLLLACRDLKVDGVLTSTMDSAVPTIGWLNEQLGLKGVRAEPGRKSASKLEAKRTFLSAGVPTARYALITPSPDLEEMVQALRGAMEGAGFTFPVMLKPARGAGSQGVYKVEGLEDARRYLPDVAYWAGQAQADILVEEFMVGREVSAEIITLGDTPVILQLTDKTITPPPVCIEVGHLQPSTAWEDPVLLEQIRKVVQEAISALGLTDWPTHLELMVTAEGPKVVEINPRISGDTIGSHLVPRSTNVSFLEISLKTVLGQLDREELVSFLNPFRQCVAVRFVPPIPGKHLKGIRCDRMDLVDAVVTYHHYGHLMGEFLSNYDRLAGYITVGKTREQVRQQLEEIFTHLTVETLEGSVGG